jgi:polyphenol oxidase
MFFINKEISIFFGDNITAPFFCREFKDSIETNISFLRDRVSEFPLLADKYIFLHQIHSINGKIYNYDFFSFDYKGDYLITDKYKVALGVLTADCLPIIFYDQKNRVIAIAHSGWRGSLGGIFFEVVQEMSRAFNTNLKDIKVYLGPCGKVCCYEVSSEFLSTSTNKFFKKSILSKNQKIFFDNIEYVILNLVDFGIGREQINLDFNLCTICNLRFASHRRSGINAKRQVTLVKLNDLQM